MNLFDLYIESIREADLSENVIRFFQLPKSIRKLICSSVIAKGESLRELSSEFIFGAGVHWSFNDSNMNLDEIEIESYLKSISRPTDNGVIIFFNKFDYDEFYSFVEDVKNVYIEENKDYYNIDI
jgi:hypothetical protein